jgi:hypothetical protein
LVCYFFFLFFCEVENAFLLDFLLCVCVCVCLFWSECLVLVAVQRRCWELVCRDYSGVTAAFFSLGVSLFFGGCSSRCNGCQRCRSKGRFTSSCDLICNLSGFDLLFERLAFREYKRKITSCCT